MNPETRQTLIAVLSLTIIELTALLRGFDGTVAMAYFACLLAVVSPEALDKLPSWSSK